MPHYSSSLFVCAETHLGPNGTRLEQNAQARFFKAYKSMLALWSTEKQIKVKGKRKGTTLLKQTNQTD